jgi:nicotinic acid mononucleotide adenylyltransferase
MKSFKKFLSETPEKTVVCAIGRFNPPTRGHEHLFNTSAMIANKHAADFKIYATHTHDAKKNPLTYEQKTYFMENLFPRYKRYLVKSQANNILEVAAELSSEYTNIIVIAGDDRLNEFHERLNKYNNQLYEYNSIRVISAGARDPDSLDVSRVSASLARQAASTDDYTLFESTMPNVDTKIIREVYQTVRQNMGFQASPVVNLNRNSTREAFYSGRLFKEGDSVVIRKSGQQGKITKVGANYVMVESNGIKTRHWVEDIKKA